jgi:UDP-2-acetamido-3-amino-2,3-dideoxy-glucuronate N-acetyltransferase
MTIESEVFVGHGMTFINDRYPRASNSAGNLKANVDWNCQTKVANRGASIGSGATLLGGIAIWRERRRGAGSIVTHDMPANATVTGNPVKPGETRSRK